MSIVVNRARLAERLAFASQLARRAGNHALGARAESRDLGVEAKGVHDFVTRADRSTEAMIRTALANAFPSDGFFGEETGGRPSASGYWVVDPIDGTTNYLRGLDAWAVSIAYVIGDNVELGVVYDATADRLYTAARGQGSYREDAPLSISRVREPSDAIALLGHSARTDFSAYTSLCAQLYAAGCEHRRLGAATISLVRVAEGAGELFFEAHLNAWDVLAAVLIAHEAGAEIFMPRLSQMIDAGGPVTAAVPGLVQKLGSCLSLPPPPSGPGRPVQWPWARRW